MPKTPLFNTDDQVIGHCYSYNSGDLGIKRFPVWEGIVLCSGNYSKRNKEAFTYVIEILKRRAAFERFYGFGHSSSYLWDVEERDLTLMSPLLQLAKIAE